METVNFDNTFTRELPADPEMANYRRQVLGACYSRVKPTPVAAPELVAYSSETAAMLDFSKEICQGDDFLQIFAGNSLLSGMDSYAACYGGHQFGNWAGQLGDGRAINLGEIVNSRSERLTLQLKGAGPTPYSRNADGLAVLRSSVREFLCSEAMFHLGIPTTRALSLILTGEMVERDMFYDGHPKEEPGAVLCRVAPSFIRFGNFEIFAFRNDLSTLKKLLDYTIRRDFSHLKNFHLIALPGIEGSPHPGKSPHPAESPSRIYIEWFEEVCRRTADMVAHWMRVGFVHGVMNTDNMSVLGLTIDYGPYGWLENYDPNWTPNTTDAHGRRYRFGNQPAIALWNLAQLGNAIYPLIGDVDPLQQALGTYSSRFQEQWQSMVAAKLGLRRFEPEIDGPLSDDLFKILALVETDMTIFFRQLASVNFRGDGFKSVGKMSESMKKSGESMDQESLLTPFVESYYLPAQLTEDYKLRMAKWLTRYAERLDRDNMAEEARQAQMNAVNPKYVLRNYLAQLAIDKAEGGDFSMIHKLLEVLRHPYSEQPENIEFARRRPEWARHRAGCSMLSCSS